MKNNVNQGRYQTATQVCAWCGRILDDTGRWREPENAELSPDLERPSHGICPLCADRVGVRL